MGERWGAARNALIAVGVTTVIAAVALRVGGYDPLLAGRALISGSLGSWDRLFSVTLLRATPLILTGLAVAVAFRAGVWNIGAEGQFYAGAMAATAVGLTFADLPAPLLVLSIWVAAALAGALWALVPALMRIRLGVGEVITTLLLNFVGLHLASYLVRGPLQEARGVFPQTDSLVDAAHLPVLIPGTRLHLGFLFAVLLAVGLWALLRHSRLGFRMRAAGASPSGAHIAGRIDTNRVLLITFLLSGTIAALAGVSEVTGVTFALYENLSPGYGYTAIAVALLAGLRPLGVIMTGTLFGVLEGGASAMQRMAGIPSPWVDGIEALLILTVLVVEVLSRRPTRRGEEG